MKKLIEVCVLVIIILAVMIGCFEIWLHKFAETKKLSKYVEKNIKQKNFVTAEFLGRVIYHKLGVESYRVMSHAYGLSGHKKKSLSYMRRYVYDLNQTLWRIYGAGIIVLRWECKREYIHRLYDNGDIKELNEWHLYLVKKYGSKYISDLFSFYCFKKDYKNAKKWLLLCKDKGYKVDDELQRLEEEFGARGKGLNKKK